MVVTFTGVMGGEEIQEGTCDHCGAAWVATGGKQPGMNATEEFDCPKCGKPAGKMHCAIGPHVQAVRARRKKKAE